MLSCLYCFSHNSCNRAKTQNNAGEKAIVNNHFLDCPDSKLPRFFLCLESSQRITISQCKARRAKGLDECDPCTQFENEISVIDNHTFSGKIDRNQKQKINRVKKIKRKRRG